ncbi:GntR family transcriptional regulator [Phenylobacterium sp. SCN 70-31]|uniref:FadR/GntR family transcriptional regulator n=1 Tax=Phenylobacterium sp. SCN 70-31 TaxID=1660129 RepID=UPI0025F70F65|nr:GntR family transcriptional regulator [Phenylobacterium sp. SCN 70-31]
MKIQGFRRPRGLSEPRTTTILHEQRDQIRVQIPKAAELITDVIRRQIARGELREGDPLPAEARLMEQFNVSRPTLREAFRILETEGLIRVRRGAGGGARICLPEHDRAARSFGLLLQIRRATLGEVLEARAFIEPPLAGRLAAHRTDEDVAALEAHMRHERETMEDFAAFGLATARLHQILIERAGNVTAALMVGMLDDIFRRHVTQFVGRARPDQLALNQLAVTNHQRMVDHVKAGDAVGAETAWRSHMIDLHKIIIDELGETAVVDLY